MARRSRLKSKLHFNLENTVTIHEGHGYVVSHNFTKLHQLPHGIY